MKAGTGDQKADDAPFVSDSSILLSAILPLNKP